MRSAISIAVLAAGLLVIPPAAAADPGDVALTDAQVEEFTEAAAAAGLTAAQVEAALADPAVLAATPVSFTVEEATEEVAAMPMQPGLAQRHRIRATSRLWTVTSRNMWGARVLSFSMWKYWEYDGRRVTSAPAAAAWANITRLGAGGGWEYKGVIAKSDHYVWAGGNRRGAHQSMRQGKFTHCVFKIGCVGSLHPRITIRGYYHGKSSTWGS